MIEIRTFTFYFLHFYNTYITRKNFPTKQKQRENTIWKLNLEMCSILIYSLAKIYLNIESNDNSLKVKLVLKAVKRFVKILSLF